MCCLGNINDKVYMYSVQKQFYFTYYCRTTNLTNMRD